MAVMLSIGMHRRSEMVDSTHFMPEKTILHDMMIVELVEECCYLNHKRDPCDTFPQQLVVEDAFSLPFSSLEGFKSTAKLNIQSQLDAVCASTL